MFLKTEKVKMQIVQSSIIFDNNTPFMVYTLKSTDGRFYIKTMPEPTKEYAGEWIKDGVVGKYTHYSSFDGHLMTSYVDCTITYTKFKKKIKSALVDGVDILGERWDTILEV